MHVCKTLSPASDSGLQTCTEWQVVEETAISPTNLPSLTTEQADQLLIAIVSCFVVVFIIKQLQKLFD
ncbi:hypothetical protein OIN80_17480 [Acinetobacter baumannii]|nr:hypothetical protein [Acinetobacter baumannii]